MEDSFNMIAFFDTGISFLPQFIDAILEKKYKSFSINTSYGRTSATIWHKI